MSEPTQAAVESTHIPINDLCNMGCTFCGIGRQKHFDLAEVAETLRSRRPDKVPRVSLGGGEPTLHPQLREILQHAVEVGFSERQIETNGLRLSQASYLSTLQEGGLTHIRMMLPAANEASWNRVTRLEGKVELAWQGLAAAAKAGLGIDVVIPVSRQKKRSRNTTSVDTFRIETGAKCV